MENLKSTCGECRFWSILSGEDNTGECHRAPPVLTPKGGQWPSVNGDNWCGEWRPKKFEIVGRSKVSDAEILVAVAARSGMNWGAVVRTIMAIYKIARSSAQDRLHRLADAGRIRIERVDGVKCVICDEAEAPSAADETDEPTRRKWEWSSIESEVLGCLRGAKSPVKYSHLYRHVTQCGKPIGGSAFDRIIREAVVDGKLTKSDSGLSLGASELDAPPELP